LRVAGTPVHVSPVAIVPVRLTGPEKPLRLPTVIPWIPEAPGASGPTVTGVEGDMLKSGPPDDTGTVTVRVKVPLVPVTTTLKMG
jgi:hypothetical protein